MAQSSTTHSSSDSFSVFHRIGATSNQDICSALSAGNAPRLQLPLYNLPAELILSIVDLLPAEAFINFAFANYRLLHTHGLAPALSAPRVAHLTTQTQIPVLLPLLRLPPEIILNIIKHLKPVDVMGFVLANYKDLARQGIAPPLTRETTNQLWNAARNCLDSRGRTGE